MGDSTTLQIQYERSGNIVQLKLPAKPDMVLKKIDSMTYMEDSARGQKYLLINFNSSYTTEFADLTGKHKEDYLAMIADGKVLAVPVVKERIPSHTLRILCTGTKSENLKLMESIQGKPIELYFIPRK